MRKPDLGPSNQQVASSDQAASYVHPEDWDGEFGFRFLADATFLITSLGRHRAAVGGLQLAMTWGSGIAVGKGGSTVSKRNTIGTTRLFKEVAQFRFLQGMRPLRMVCRKKLLETQGGMFRCVHSLRENMFMCGTHGQSLFRHSQSKRSKPMEQSGRDPLGS